MKTLGLIPARAGSKRLPGKNTRQLAGMPMVEWTIRAAMTCGALDRVAVTSDDNAVNEIAFDWSADVLERPAHLATDEASSYDVVRWALKLSGYEDFTHVMLLQPTSPLRTADDIDAFFWERGRSSCYSIAEGAEVANGAIYMAPVGRWRNRSFNFDKVTVMGWPMPVARSIDVDTLEDFEKAEAWLRSN